VNAAAAPTFGRRRCLFVEDDPSPSRPPAASQ
jgi:hypothetical protein